MRSKEISLGLIVLCVVVLCGPGVQAEEAKSAGDAGWKPPPPAWFENKDCPSKGKIQILSTGEFGENRTVICKTTFLFCGHSLTKTKTLKDNSGEGEHCPSSSDFSMPEICCARLDQAIKSKQPCDPQLDVNCDGIPNASDPDPFWPAPQPLPTPGPTPTSSPRIVSETVAGQAPQTNSHARISGKVTSKDGTRLSDVRMLLSGSMTTETRTDASGNYSFDNLVASGGSSYGVRPVRSDSNFDPALRAFSPLGQNQTANFIAVGGTLAEIASAQSGSSYELKPNPKLTGQTGQLVFDFIDKDARGGAMITPGNRFVSVNNEEVPLQPGAYDIAVNGALLRGVPIQQGMDTSIRMGVLNLSVAGDIYDQTKTKELIFVMPGKLALPVGAYNLKIGEAFKPVVIRDKQQTDF